MFILKMKTEKIHDQFNKRKGFIQNDQNSPADLKKLLAEKRKESLEEKKFLSEKQEEKLKP